MHMVFDKCFLRKAILIDKNKPIDFRVTYYPIIIDADISAEPGIEAATVLHIDYLSGAFHRHIAIITDNNRKNILFVQAGHDLVHMVSAPAGNYRA